MSLMWAAFIVAAATLFLLQILSILNKKTRLPPGPRGIPVLGHLHLLGKNPHQDLYKLSRIHGPIMSMRFGFVNAIVVSSPESAEQFLKANDLIFAGRPSHEGSKLMSYGQSNITFGQYGPYWRNMRKLCTLELLSNHKISSFQTMRREEVGILVNSLKDSAENRVPVDVSAKIASLSADMTCLMVFGKKFKDTDIDPSGFKAVIQEVLLLAALPNLGEFFPFLGVLDLQGLTRRMKAIAKVTDGFLEQIIEEHAHHSKPNKQNKDFVDTMMMIMESGNGEFQFNRRQMKSVLLDLLIASMDTTATAIEWLLSELLRHPQVMEKLQRELEEVVGMQRMVEESDLGKLEYLHMVVKESFRLHPPGPLMIPHESLEDCTVDGYNIPKKSRILVNVWAIGRDPKAWPDPDRFNPERFAGRSIDVRGRDFELLPFGSGRRICPGMQLGLTVVQFVVAQLVHCFNWELPNDDLDMTEAFALVLHRASQLIAIPSYRLHGQYIAGEGNTKRN